MNTLIGLVIIAIGSFGQSSSYVPINKVKNWSWETFWFTQGIFAWLIFPLLGALMAVPEGSSLGKLFTLAGNEVWKSVGFGVLWGVGGLTFGLSMRYLGIALGQSVALGTCAAFGTIIPTMIPSLFPDAEKMTGLLIIGVAIMLAGIATIGYAGSLRAKNMTEEERKAAIKDFALTKGLLVALLAGVMSACFNLGLEAGKPIRQAIMDTGVNPLFAGLPVVLMVTLGGFVTNASYCIRQHVKNKSGKEYFSVNKSVLTNNLLFCALAGGLWYSQFFGFEMGKSFLTDSPVLLAFSWSILMSLNVLFSNFWGIVLKEWKGAGRSAVMVLVLGLVVLISSIIVVAIARN